MSTVHIDTNALQRRVICEGSPRCSGCGGCVAKRASDRAWSSEDWITYFRWNARRLMPVDWSAGVAFTAEERAAVADSLREFQLGESGNGLHFLACARRYADRTGDWAYPVALAHFIGEEQRHVETLGRVLDDAGEPRARSLAMDSVFRHLRKLAGLEVCITVLVTAELVAQVYYACLLRATESPVLRTVCRQILRDEVQHVRFQCQRLATLRARRGRARNAIAVAAQSGLLLVTSAALWRKHGPVFRRGGLGYCQTVAALWRKWRTARRLMRRSGKVSPTGISVLASPSHDR